jgi:chorismate mutase
MNVTNEAVSSVEEGRAQLDGIDAEIHALLQRRRAVSHAVQDLRRDAGRPRIEHARENEIIAAYREALGRPGVSLALTILELCRGRA